MFRQLTHGYAAVTCLVVAALLTPASAYGQEPTAQGEPAMVHLPQSARLLGWTARDAHTSIRGLDSQLSAVASAATQSPWGWRSVAADAELRTAGESVQVEISTAAGGAAALAPALAGIGGYVTGTGADETLAQAWVPATSLRAVSALPGVLAVRAPATFKPANGRNTTEADNTLNGPLWRNEGFAGGGVKVGIIDLGFSGWHATADYEWANPVVTANFVDGETQAEVDGGTEHGTACIEVITDIANSAELYLAKIETRVDLEEAVNWLISQDVDIISSSITAHNAGPGDGTGWFEDIVATARAAGIIWFTAGGNSREQHWGGAANVDQNGYQLFATGQTVNWFGPGDGDAYFIPAGEVFSVSARWSDWTAPVDQDYDILLLRWNGTAWDALVDAGNQIGGLDTQDGGVGQEPTETAYGITTGEDTAYAFAIGRYSGSQGVNLEIFADLPLDRQVYARSLDSTATASSVVAVGAIDWWSDTQAYYSGEGPRNGPGGVATGGAKEPAIGGYAGVTTATYGPHAFDGTSAATPHVAGAAALILSAYPDWTPDQVEQYLVENAVDMGTAGPDNQFGAGALRLGPAPGTSDTVPPEVGAPWADFIYGSTVAKTKRPISLLYKFPADDAWGVTATRLQEKIGSNGFVDLALPQPASTEVTVSAKPSATNLRTLRASARDAAGNVAPWSTAAPWRLRVFQDGNTSIVKKGTWKSVSSSNYYGGTARYATAAGASQGITATMTDVAIVLTRGPKMGVAKVWFDGYEQVIDLYSPTAKYRTIVFTWEWGLGAHTVRVSATGSKNPASGGTRVEFDAFLVIGP